MKENKWVCLHPRDPIQLQSWLEELSLEGWKLEQAGGDYGMFRRVPPHRIRYRILPAQRPWEDKPLRCEEEEDRRYQDMGWQLLGKTNRDLWKLYCAEDPDAPEIHTDGDIEKVLLRRGLRRTAVWGLVVLVAFLVQLMKLVNGLWGSDAAWDLASLRTGRVVALAAFGCALLRLIFYAWEQCAPCWKVRRKSSASARPRPTAKRERLRLRLVSVLMWALSLAPLGVLAFGLTSLGNGIEAYPSDYFAYDLDYDPQAPPGGKQVPCVDIRTVEHSGTYGSTLWEAYANTFTAAYASRVSQSVEPDAPYLPLGYFTTECYHMRSPYFADLAQEKLLLEAEDVEVLSLPETDWACRGLGRGGEDPFLLARRGSRLVYLTCSGGLADLDAQTEAAVDLLDWAPA